MRVADSNATTDTNTNVSWKQLDVATMGNWSFCMNMHT
jgi:hypothetical protein